MIVKIPVNTKAIIYLPTAHPDLVTEGNRPINNANGMYILGTVHGKLKIEVGSGSYHFFVSDKKL